MEPLISIIITVFNKEKYISECIESVQKQTISNIEIICVDDGSQDNSGQICQQYSRFDSRIKVVHKENGGQVSAIKYGISIASAKYIGFVDADDWVDPDMFRILYEKAEKEELDFISTGIIQHNRRQKIKFDLAKEGIYESIEQKKELYTQFFNSSNEGYKIIGNAVTKLYRTDILRISSKHIPVEVHFREDDCFVYSYMLRCERIGVLHQAYYHYRSVPDSDSNKADELFFARVNMFYLFLKKEFENSIYASLLRPQLDHYFVRTLVEGINKADFYANSCISVSYPLLDARRVVVYGAGECGLRIIRRIINSPEYTLVGVLDIDWENKQNEMYQVLPVDEIKNLVFDVVLIAILNKKISQAVYENLKNMGIEEAKLSIL